MSRLSLDSSLRSLVFVVVVGLASGGCALTSRSTPLDIHYFSPEKAVPTAAERAPSAPPSTSRPRLRVGAVSASDHVRTSIVFRTSSVELGTYEDRRWSESPEVYLRRSLGRALFDDRLVVQTLGSGAPTLDVELVSFEEIRHGSGRAGRVEVIYTLHDEHDVLASDPISVEIPARSEAMDDVVTAIARALAEVSMAVAEAVRTHLGLAKRAGTSP